MDKRSGGIWSRGFQAGSAVGGMQEMDAFSFPTGDNRYSYRRDSRGQEDGDDVFQDAQETWGSASTSSNFLSTSNNSKSTTSSDSQSTQPHQASESPAPPDLPAIPSRHPSRLSESPRSRNIARTPFVYSNPSPPARPSRSRQPSPPYAASSRDGAPTPGPDAGTRYDKECDICREHTRDIWYCNICKYSFCDPCWGSQFVHKEPRRRTGPGGIPHEKTDPTVAATVHRVLFPPTDDRAREQLYRADDVTSWFGVERPDDSGPPVFQSYGRFAELMASTDPVKNNPREAFLENAAQLGRDSRTPSLVSFVGQTGAGKSTLVKLMIDFALQGDEIHNYSTPVVGTPGAHLPTSEDVHLYMDPRTANSHGPLLYADCEGLEGGEREPLGAKFRKKWRSDQKRDADAADKVLKGNKVISEWELRWANGPREESREFAVTNLYPRLLYTFSDVIVFVLRNSRVIEHVFERLIKWAAAAIETSSNQPVLPHAIIVLNASENDIDQKLWDVPVNTESILEDLAHTVNRNETFKKWAQFWRERGKAINTLDELVLCYYSSIQILRLPQEGRPKLMQEQVDKLYRGTLTACVAARCARNRLRMLLDVDDLQAYLQEAFSHYTSTLDSPFDFVQASFRNSPIPPDFGGNILKMALNVMDISQEQSDSSIDARRIFSELSYMVASCIMLANARHKSKGSAEQIFPKYMNHLDDALENFCDHHWPCEFVNPKNQRCVNVRVGHESKGHQSKDGKVFATGDYVSSFSFENDSEGFRDTVYLYLVALLGELTSRVQNGEIEEQAAASLHKDMVLAKLSLHTTTGDDRIKTEGFLHSHTACFCCLFEQAEHALPCGHVLCTPCVTMYGQWRGSNEIEIFECPIASAEHQRYSSCVINLKPKSAGVRIMTLDGGGIRGIVELEVLRQIELALGGHIPIQYFFDLIVGTSTGGLIALGLTSMQWSVGQCIQHFEDLCNDAFTRRAGATLPVIGHLVENYHHSKYQTTTLESAMVSAFTKDIYLFGGPRPAELCRLPTKVAVTATSLAGNKPYLLSNYNRPRSSHCPSSYHFQRPERITSELKVWEAARATSAAPRFFKSFHHEMSQKTYIDGAVQHNNPVRVADAERKILWPEHEMPDIFLSIGTGSSLTLERQTSERMAAAKKGVVSHGLTLFNILKKTMEATLDCERAWNEYFDNITSMLRPSVDTTRFLRINPGLEGHIPALDEKEKIGNLRKSVEMSLVRDPVIGRVARQLLASTFYFQLSPPVEQERNGKYCVQGKILCRLRQPSREVHELGKHLQQMMLEYGELSFVVCEESREKSVLKQLRWSHNVMETMIRDQKFEMERLKFRISNKAVSTQIYFRFGNRNMLLISGFPRSLFADEHSEIHARTSHTSLPSVHAGFNAFAHSSSRYTHGSRRRKKATDWEAPELHDRPSLTNLRRYADQNRGIGLDMISLQKRTAAEVDKDRLQPGIRAQVTVLPTLNQPQQRQHEEKSLTVTTLRNAFRALLWPIRSRPMPSNKNTPWEEDLSKFVDSEAHPAHSPDYPNQITNPPSMQYYHVNAAENDIYQHWVNLLGPSMGRWVPLDQPGEFLESSSSSQIFEMPGDSIPAVELPG